MRYNSYYTILPFKAYNSIFSIIKQGLRIHLNLIYSKLGSVGVNTVMDENKIHTRLSKIYMSNISCPIDCQTFKHIIIHDAYRFRRYYFYLIITLPVLTISLNVSLCKNHIMAWVFGNRSTYSEDKISWFMLDWNGYIIRITCK